MTNPKDFRFSDRLDELAKKKLISQKLRRILQCEYGNHLPQVLKEEMVTGGAMIHNYRSQYYDADVVAKREALTLGDVPTMFTSEEGFFRIPGTGPVRYAELMAVMTNCVGIDPEWLERMKPKEKPEPVVKDEITVWDYYAVAALAGVLSSPSDWVVASINFSGEKQEKYCALSAAIADKMMEIRSKRGIGNG